MGLMITTRATPPATKIRRGIGLILLGVLIVAVGQGLIAADSDPLVVLGLALSWVGFLAGLAGLTLLLWGLLRD